MRTQDRWPPEIARARHEAWSSRKILRVVRAFCVECMGGAAHEIARCTSRHCPLFPFRSADSVRQGFDAAADALEKEGLPELAARSRELRAANMQAWTDRKSSILATDSRDSFADDTDAPDDDPPDGAPVDGR